MTEAERTLQELRIKRSDKELTLKEIRGKTRNMLRFVRALAD